MSQKNEGTPLFTAARESIYDRTEKGLNSGGGKSGFAPAVSVVELAAEFGFRQMHVIPLVATFFSRFAASLILGGVLFPAPYTTSYNATSLVIGAAVGSLIAGLATDYFGRRRVLQVYLFLTGIFGLAVLLVPSSFSVVIDCLSVCLGLCVCALAIVPPLQLFEFLPPNQVILIAVTLEFAFFTGIAVFSVVSGYISLSIGIALAFIMSFVLWFSQENPRWLISWGRKAESKAVLQNLFKSEELFGATRSVTCPTGISASRKPGKAAPTSTITKNLADVLTNRNTWYCTYLGVLLGIMQYIFLTEFEQVSSLFCGECVAVTLAVGGSIGLVVCLCFLAFSRRYLTMFGLLVLFLSPVAHLSFVGRFVMAVGLVLLETTFLVVVLELFSTRVRATAAGLFWCSTFIAAAIMSVIVDPYEYVYESTSLTVLSEVSIALGGFAVFNLRESADLPTEDI